VRLRKHLLQEFRLLQVLCWKASL